jgi:hypothetical protein
MIAKILNQLSDFLVEWGQHRAKLALRHHSYY